MQKSRSTEAKIAFNIYDSTHKLLRELSEQTGKAMIVLLKELVEAEANKSHKAS